MLNEWIEALESNTYTQGYRRMRHGDDSFCAVGVLGDLLVRKGLAYWYIHKRIWTLIGSDYAPAIGLLSDKERSHINNIPECIPLPFNRDVLIEVMQMNDWDKESFNTIANWLREHVSN